MKNKILEVQNYFLNRITACDFKIISTKESNGSIGFETEIDGFLFNLSVHPKLSMAYTMYGSFMCFDIPKDRLNNLLNLVETQKKEMRAKQIEELTARLEALKETAEV